MQISTGAIYSLTLVLTSGCTHDAAWRAPPPFLFPELSLDEAGPLARVAPSLCLLEISPQNSPRSCPPNLFSRDNCLACRLSKFLFSRMDLEFRLRCPRGGAGASEDSRWSWPALYAAAGRGTAKVAPARIVPAAVVTELRGCGLGERSPNRPHKFEDPDANPPNFKLEQITPLTTQNRTNYPPDANWLF
jgi:hypothetical protein